MPTASVPEGVPKYLLIDGQHRLTTLTVGSEHDQSLAWRGRVGREIFPDPE